MSQCRLMVTAQLPADLLREFTQYLRDFDTAHPGCHFQMEAVVDLSMAEVEAALDEIEPPLPVRKTVRKQ